MHAATDEAVLSQTVINFKRTWAFEHKGYGVPFVCSLDGNNVIVARALKDFGKVVQAHACMNGKRCQEG